MALVSKHVTDAGQRRQRGHLRSFIGGNVMVYMLAL